MKPFSQLRQGWDEVAAEKARLLCALTTNEGISEYLALQSEFEPQLQETEPVFRQPPILLEEHPYQNAHPCSHQRTGKINPIVIQPAPAPQGLRLRAAQVPRSALSLFLTGRAVINRLHRSPQE